MKIILSFFLIIILVFADNAISQNNRIALHFSECSEYISPGKPLEQITHWELFLIKNNIEYDVIYDEQIVSGISASEYHTIIFPYSKCFSDKAFNSIEDFLNSGGSIIVFGSFGLYDEKLNYTGWGRFELFSGIQFRENLQIDSVSSLLRINEYQPFTNDIYISKDIRFTLKNSPPVVTRYSDDIKIIGSVNTNLKSNDDERVIVFHVNKNKGNIVWSSIETNDIIGEKQDIKNFENLILNFITLNSGKTFAWISKKRDASQPDISILFDVSTNLSEITNILDLAKKFNMKPGFIISSSESNAEFLKTLSINGQLIPKFSASELTDIEEGFLAREYFSEKIRRIEDITGEKILSSLFTVIPDNAMIFNELKNTGIENVLIPDHLFPPESITGLIFIPLADSWNEIHLHNDKSNLSPGPLERFSSGQSKKIKLQQTLIIYNSEIDCSNESINEFELFLNRLTGDNYSLISFEEHLIRLNVIHNIKLSIRKTEDQRVEITAGNYSNYPSGYITIEVTDRAIRSSNNITMDLKNNNVTYYLDRLSGNLRVFIDNLNKGESVILPFEIR